MHLHIFVSSGYKNIILNPAEKRSAEGPGKDPEHLRNHDSRGNARLFSESFGVHFWMKLSRKGEIPLFQACYHHRQRAMMKVMRKTKPRFKYARV